MAMNEITLTPRFCETDALGHINNTTLPIWFEAGRLEFFRRVHPSMTIDDWPLVLVQFDVNMKRQIFFGTEVTVKTGIERLGNSSINLYHEIWQNGEMAANSRGVIVYFDHEKQRSMTIPDSVRRLLDDLLMDSAS